MNTTAETFAPSPAQGATNHPALAATHWWADCSEAVSVERAGTLAPLAAAFYQGGPAAVITAARGKTRDGYVSRAWSLSMTATHGPIGTHPEQTQHPEVLAAKAAAETSLRTYLSV